MTASCWIWQLLRLLSGRWSILLIIIWYRWISIFTGQLHSKFWYISWFAPHSIIILYCACCVWDMYCCKIDHKLTLFTFAGCCHCQYLAVVVGHFRSCTWSLSAITVAGTQYCLWPPVAGSMSSIIELQLQAEVDVVVSGRWLLSPVASNGCPSLLLLVAASCSCPELSPESAVAVVGHFHSSLQVAGWNIGNGLFRHCRLNWLMLRKKRFLLGGEQMLQER